MLCSFNGFINLLIVCWKLGDKMIVLFLLSSNEGESITFNFIIKFSLLNLVLIFKSVIWNMSCYVFKLSFQWMKIWRIFNLQFYFLFKSINFISKRIEEFLSLSLKSFLNLNRVDIVEFSTKSWKFRVLSAVIIIELFGYDSHKDWSFCHSFVNAFFAE